MRAALLIAVSVALLIASGAPSAADPARAFLAERFGLTPAEIARIDKGQVLARTLEVSNGREVATLAILRAAIPHEFYAGLLSDIVRFKKDDAVLQIGGFSNPPEVRDLDGLTIEGSDLKALRSCRVEHCDVQLSREMIERVGAAVDWTRPDAQAQAAVVMKQGLADYVARYRASGAQALMVYADRPRPLDVGAEFSQLVDEDPILATFPELRRHMLAPAATAPAGGSDVLYWSKETMRKPVVTITHLATWRPPADSPAALVAASKQIYATHYLDASMGLTVLVPDRASASPATYVVYVNRSRVDVLSGAFAGITRRLIRSRTRSAVEGQMQRLKARLEREYNAR